MNIGLYVKKNRDINYECALTTVKAIIANGATPVLRPSDKESFPAGVGGVLFEDFNNASLDVMISIGGDGTFLGMISEYRDLNVDFIGINKGSIGFLTRISVDDVEQSIKNIITGQYRTVSRSQLLVKVFNKDGVLKGSDICLNDVSICRGDKPHITRLQLTIDGQYVERFFGDGIVISTATGSTAYSLAAGGPLLMPNMRDIIITSVCSHTLPNISYVASPESTVEIFVESFENAPIICPDGHDFINLESEDKIVITLYEKTVKTIFFGEDSFYSDVRRKIIQRGSFYEKS